MDSRDNQQRMAKSLWICFCLALAWQPTFGAELEHPLFRAIKSRDDNRVAQLLRQGTPVNLRASDGTTPLMIAALHGTHHSMRALLDRGANPHVSNEHGETPLHWSVTDLEKIKLLLQYDVNINTRTAQGMTPLHSAASLPTGAPVVEILLANGADITSRDARGRSALHGAIKANSMKSVTLFFSHAEKNQQADELVGDDAASLLEVSAGRGAV
ncbi:MAG: ankyrin repeat domain-containing protein, partial [Planctomycetota bacterium]